MADKTLVRGKTTSRKGRVLALALSLALAMSSVPVFPHEKAYAASAISGGSSHQVTRGNCNSFDSISFNGKTVNAIYPVGYKNSGSDKTYCCAAFVKKFYKTIWGVDVWNLIYPGAPKTSNGQFYKTNSPVVGDIVATTNHWAIVKSISGNKVTVIEQNWSWMRGGNLWATKGRVCSLSGSGTTFYHWSGYKNDNVKPTPTVSLPSIWINDTLGGKDVSISTSTQGATIHYTTDGATNPSMGDGNIYRGAFFDNWSRMGVRAIAGKSGWSTSGIAYKTIDMVTAANPTMAVTNTSNGATVSIYSSTPNTEIYYTTDGTDPKVGNGKVANGNRYAGTLLLKENCEVKALAVGNGILPSSVTTNEVLCKVPAKPNAREASSKVAVGDAAQVTWKVDSTASEYVATLYRGGEVVDEVTTKGTMASFTLGEVGEYQIGVMAKNFVGSSEQSDTVSVEAKAPCTVRFVDMATDENGEEVVSLINEQTVRYGYGATKPASPKKKGYTFSGWSASYGKITSDVEILAEWDINTYVVQFYAQDGTTRLSRQVVEYQSPAEAPYPGDPAEGYVFSGWAVMSADDDSERDYAKVDSNMKLRAVYAWGDRELPVVSSIASASRTASGNYSVNVHLANYPEGTTTALLRVALKTSGGKLVQTSRETVELAPGGTCDRQVTLKYSGDYIATVAEVEVVGLDGNYRTGGAYSEAVQAHVDSSDDFTYTDWTEWSADKPVVADGVEMEVEEATQYRHRDKQTTVSTAESMQGWVRDGTLATSYGNWSSTSSTTSKPSASDTLRITNQSTSYKYYRYCNYYGGAWQQDSVPYGSNSVYHEVTLSSPMAGNANKFGDQGGKAWDIHGPYSSCNHKRSGQSYWWTKSTVTTYSYQTRSKTVTYGYYKWGDWSDWGLTQVTGSDSREVENRTVYRYRVKNYNDLTEREDKTGTLQSLSGVLNVDTDLAGKQATIMVYSATNTDPNEDQMQYIGQTVIGEGNTYSFSFTPRCDPTIESGDYIVSLGVKGSTGLVNVATIKAPKPTYKVSFQYQDASGEVHVISSQEISEGGNASVPDAPQLEGCRFVGWSANSTRVNSDMVINAMYEPNTYTVAWVDWVNQSVYMQQCEYGAKLVAPGDPSQADGYEFSGWDALAGGVAEVTGNLVVNAVWTAKTYEVSFLDADGKVLDSQIVTHGQSATLPAERPVSEGKVFLGWDTSDEENCWWNVMRDVAVKPVFAYELTADSPVGYAEISSGYVSSAGTKVYFETATEGAAIHYTVDGSEPTQESPVYDGEAGVTVNSAVQVKAAAFKDEMNPSCSTTVAVDVEQTNDVANADFGLGDYGAYSGKAVEPVAIVRIGDTLLVEGMDYETSYENNNAAGLAIATIRGIGRYTGSQSIGFTIEKMTKSDWAEHIYAMMLDRMPTDEEAEALLKASEDGTPADAIKVIAKSDEFAGRGLSDEETVRILYKAICGNENPSATDVSLWSFMLGSGTSIDAVIGGIARGESYVGYLDLYGMAEKVKLGATATASRCSSSTALLSVSVENSNNEKLSYQWQRAETVDAEWANVSGGAESSLSVAMRDFASEARYRCMVTAADGRSATSNVLKTLDVPAAYEKTPEGYALMLYAECFDVSEPAEHQVSYWSGVLANEEGGPERAVREFFASSVFEAKPASERSRLLYQVVAGVDEPTDFQVSYWAGVIESGGMSGLLDEFCSSDLFKA